MAPASRNSRRSIAAMFVCVGVGAAVFTATGDGGFGLFLGGVVLLMLGPLLPIALASVPIVWCRGANLRWRLAATAPAVSLVAVICGYVVPGTHLLPSVAFSNLGPPYIAGVWGAANLVYIGALGLKLPDLASSPARRSSTDGRASD